MAYPPWVFASATERPGAAEGWGGMMARNTPACLRRIRKRQGRCYELANRVVFKETGWRLIHGRLHASVPVVPYEHAWLERDGNFYDPVLDKWFDAAEYVTTFGAVIDRSYSAKEAAHALLEHNHHGPW
jgi:hypothetical protein